MEPGQIWDLIVKADEALKYSAGDKAGPREEKAADLLRRALEEAEAISNEPLAEQARTRLRDLKGKS